MNWQISIDGQEPILVDLPSRITRDAWLPVSIDKKAYQVQWNSTLRAFYLRDENGLERSVKLRSQQMTQFPGEAERTFDLEISSRGRALLDRFETKVEPYVPGSAFRKSADSGGGATVRSPMVGKLISVAVADGDSVTKGQELLVIEAMKMENKILAPQSGIVSKLKAKAGEQTSVGDQLLKIEVPEES